MSYKHLPTPRSLKNQHYSFCPIPSPTCPALCLCLQLRLTALLLQPVTPTLRGLVLHVLPGGAGEMQETVVWALPLELAVPVPGCAQLWELDTSQTHPVQSPPLHTHTDI